MNHFDFIKHLLGSSLSSSAKLMMLVLINHRNFKTGICYPSYSTLSQECSLSVRSIQRAKEELEEAGFIKTEQKKVSASGYKCNHYIIDIEDVVMATQSTSLSTTMSTPVSIDMTIDSTIVTESNKLTKHIKPIIINNDQFEKFWNLYPRKVSKRSAKKAFDKALTKTEFEIIFHGLEAACKIFEKTDKQFIPHASTWLTNERWLDEIANRSNLPSKEESRYAARLDGFKRTGIWREEWGDKPS